MKAKKNKNKSSPLPEFNNAINFKITKINPVKFFVGRHSLNELELKTLQLEVAEGKKQAGIMVKDEKGNIASIQEDGRLDNFLYGLDLATNLNIKIVQANRIKESTGWRQ